MRAMTRTRFAVLVALALIVVAPAGAADLTVGLQRSPGGAVIFQPTGDVTLTATYPGAAIEYQFWYQVKTPTGNYDWFLACDWSTTDTCVIPEATIAATGKYTFQAYARRPGSTAADGYSAGDRADIVTPTTASGNYPDDWIGYPRTQVFFGWVAPQDTTDVIGYQIEIKNKDLDTNQTFDVGIVFGANFGLAAGYGYKWWVRTRLSGGLFGPYSPEKHFGIAVPRALTPAMNAFLNTPTADFTWSPVSPGNGYELTLDDLSTPAIDTTVQIPGNLDVSHTLPLTPDTDYQWWVKATGVDGAGITPPITFFTGPTPQGIGTVSVPTGVDTAQGTNYTLTWTSRNVPTTAVAEIWYYHGSTNTWQHIGGPPVTGQILANTGANTGSFNFTIPNIIETARFWVGSCQVGQLTGPGGRCSSFPYGSAAGPFFTVTP